MARTLAISIAPDQNLLQRLLYYDRDGRRVKSVITTNLGSTPTVSPTPTVPVFSNAQFTYDGDGRRVKSVITTNLGSTPTYFVGAHYAVTDGIVTKYYFAGATRIAMRKAGTLYYMLSDHLGSTSIVTFENGNLVSQTKYKAWGDVRHQSGPSLTEYTYTGQYSYTGSFGLMYYNARWYDPYLNHFTQPDSIVPDPYNSQDYDRYAYARNNPVRYTDPSGHVTCEGANWDDGPKCTSKSSFWAKATVARFTNVTIKNPDDGNVQELRTLYNTLSNIYSAFGESSSAFNSAFGDVTFEIVPDGSLGEAAGMAYWGTGLIQLTHSAFSPYYDVSGWAIAHEMGHIFDVRWSDGDPKKYYSNLFVEVLNGGCGHLGSNGCLGSNPPDGYSKWYYFGQDVGDYNPPSRQTTGYALEGGSMEDFAESFAATVLGDPHNYVHPKREFIIQTYINLVVSNSP